MIMRGRASIVVAIALAGCATTGGPGGTVDSKLADVIALIQSKAVTYCKFEPTIATVGAIVATFGGPGVVMAEGLLDRGAKAICGAVTGAVVTEIEEGYLPVMLASYEVAQATPPVKVQPRTAKTPPKVNGVVVHGRCLDPVVCGFKK